MSSRYELRDLHGFLHFISLSIRQTSLRNYNLPTLIKAARTNRWWLTFNYESQNCNYFHSTIFNLHSIKKLTFELKLLLIFHTITSPSLAAKYGPFWKELWYLSLPSKEMEAIGMSQKGWGVLFMKKGMFCGVIFVTSRGFCNKLLQPYTAWKIMHWTQEVR